MNIDDFAAIVNNMTDNARLSFVKADLWSQMMDKTFIGTEHLLLGMVSHQDSVATRFLAELGIDQATIERSLGLEHHSELPLPASGGKMLDDEARLAFEAGWRLAMEHQQNYLGTEHLLFGLLARSNCRASLILKDLGVDLGRLQQRLVEFVAKQAVVQNRVELRPAQKQHSRQSLLARFGVDLVERALRAELDPVIGRADQIERLTTILSRRNKSNPMLVGEPGVGKTAIVEALAQKIAKADVPTNLIGARIIQLDLAAMIAGTKYRGEFEERLKRVIGELTDNPQMIGFIDEMHLLMGAGATEGAMDAANILKPALARGQIRLIGATTYDEYRRHIQKDQALDRRFQLVEVSEPSLEETVQIIKGLKRTYEKHHATVLSEEVIRQAVVLADRYITDRFMPDKAIDLIDEAAALRRVRKDKIKPEYRQVIFEIAKLEQELEQALREENYQAAARFKAKLDQIETSLVDFKRQKRTKTTTKLELADIAKVVSLRTGIPVQQLTKSQKKAMLNLEKSLAKAIIGQSTALAEVAKAIRRSSSGIGNTRRPIGSFIFLGPSGVGKTELAKVLAREVFGSEEALFKIDMSEFTEKHAISRLLGAPAGYVGYDDGAKLTDAIRRRPYQVVLFDEIEKADGEIYNLLLQILDDGMLRDAKGQQINFRNTIIILTSNLGTEEIAQAKKGNYGFGQSSIDKTTNHKKLAVEALDRFMPLELINRFDDVIVFNNLTPTDAKQITELMLQDLKKRLQAQDLTLETSLAVKRWLVKAGFDDKKGARLLRRTIEERLENIIAEALLAEKIKPGDTIKVGVKKDQLGVVAK